MSRGVRVLGVDPGLANLGLAVLRLSSSSRSGTVELLRALKTKPPQKRRRLLQADADADRLRYLLGCIRETMEEHRPAVVVYEAPVGGRSARGVKSLAYVVGSLVTLCDERSLPLLSVSPTDVKVEATGIRNASKEAVVEAMRKRFPSDCWADVLPSAVDHAADALAAAASALRSDAVLMAARMRA